DAHPQQGRHRLQLAPDRHHPGPDPEVQRHAQGPHRARRLEAAAEEGAREAEGDAEAAGPLKDAPWNRLPWVRLPPASTVWCGLGSPRTIPSMREAISPKVYDSKGRPSAARRLRRLLRLLGRLLRLRLRGGGRGGGLVHVVELLDQVLGDVDLGRVVVDDALVEDERQVLLLPVNLQSIDEHLLEPVLDLVEL